ncbi:hypothetical protein L2E82_45901 [Cichorium intybus]|uniref:Uncharacterized protein n=1 Tax=Cichorium intybus TaxID=13427 RepID=A0ACB8ZUS0_CICIN|nr:hypothetical protein L2E82_45901 [Cichorium intybus]
MASIRSNLIFNTGVVKAQEMAIFIQKGRLSRMRWLTRTIIDIKGSMEEMEVRETYNVLEVSAQIKWTDLVRVIALLLHPLFLAHCNSATHPLLLSVQHHLRLVSVLLPNCNTECAKTKTDAGIYVGDDKVVHFTSHKGNKSSNTPKSEVIITSLDVFLRNGDLYRYEYGVTKYNFMDKIRGGCCTTATSNKTDTVIHRANYLLKENGFGKYSLTNNNCEDFSLYCKTGLRIIGTTQMRSSGQVAAVVSSISSMSWLPMPLLVLSPSLWLLVSLKQRVSVSVSLSLSSVALLPKPILTLTVVSPELRKLNADIGSRYDVEKVCVAKLVDKMHLR